MNEMDLEGIHILLFIVVAFILYMVVMLDGSYGGIGIFKEPNFFYSSNF